MPEPIRLAALVATSKAVRETGAKLEKRAHLTRLFASASAGDLRLAANYLSGEIPQGSLQVGWGTLVAAERASSTELPLFAAAATPPSPAPSASPTLTQIDAAFEALRGATGPGSTARRQAILQDLLASLTAEERRFLAGLLLGELHQGALRAAVLEALAAAHAVPVEELRRAVMFAGTMDAVLRALATEGVPALARIGPQPGVPIEPMLAAQAGDVATALQELGGRAGVEWKLDGVRLQLHRHGDDVRVFSRQLRDVTALVPEAVALGRRLAATSLILDGELIGEDESGRPVPFQILMSGFSRESKAAGALGREGDLFAATSAQAEPSDVGVGGGGASSPSASGHGDGATGASRAGAGGATATPARLRPIFFDVLEMDGAVWIERPYAERRRLLEQLLPTEERVPQGECTDADCAQEIYAQALAAGHEGVVLKELESTYTAGRRGSTWRKVKPAVTLDLVILAAEWGPGRRRGYLSNLHLGARDPADVERFFMLGKTFKGLTDAMLQEMTADLLTLETRRDGHVVYVRPLRVVEVAFDGLQRSPRYDSGLALRFARVKRFRPDKSPVEATSLDEVRALMP